MDSVACSKIKEVPRLPGILSKSGRWRKKRRKGLLTSFFDCTFAAESDTFVVFQKGSYFIFINSTPRRDAGVVERAALEMRWTGNCSGGSNPSLSAWSTLKLNSEEIKEKRKYRNFNELRYFSFIHHCPSRVRREYPNTPKRLSYGYNLATLFSAK